MKQTSGTIFIATKMPYLTLWLISFLLAILLPQSLHHCNVQSAMQNLNKLNLVLNTSGLEVDEALSRLLSAFSLPCIALESRLNASSIHDIPVDVDRSRLNEWILANSEEDIALISFNQDTACICALKFVNSRTLPS